MSANLKTILPFVDISASHARARGAALDPAAEGRLFGEPAPVILSEADLPRLRKQIAENFNATAHAFASLGVPAPLRWLVCVLFAAAAVAEEEAEKDGHTIFDGEVVKFKASYKTLVELCYQANDGRSHGAKKSEIARQLKALVGWQIKSQKTLCTVRTGGRIKGEQGDEYHDSEFELSILNVIAKSLIREPSPSKMRGVVLDEARAMYKLPPADNRFRPGQSSPKQIQERDAKAAATKAVKAALAELDLPGGGDPFLHLDRQYEEMKRRLALELEKRGETPQTSYPRPVEKVPSVENTQVDEQGGVPDPAHPPMVPVGEKIAPIEEENKVLFLHESAPAAPSPAPDPADVAAWDHTFACLTAPKVQLTPVHLAPAAALVVIPVDDAGEELPPVVAPAPRLQQQRTAWDCYQDYLTGERVKAADEQREQRAHIGNAPDGETALEAASEPDYFADGPPPDLEDEPAPDEIAEAEAIRAEACGELIEERHLE